VPVVLLVGGISFAALRAGDSGPDALERTAAELAAESSDDVAALELRGAQTGQETRLTLPSGSAVEPTPTSTTAPAAPEETAPETTASPQTQQPAEQQGNRDDGNRVDIHIFADHVVETLGAQMLTADQVLYGGYERVGPGRIQAQSTITGLRPVIEQAIDDVTEHNRRATGEELERKIAKRLTELNDWKNLNDQTRTNMILLSGIDIASMDRDEREHRINHLLHSPLPFGDIEEVLTPDVTIDLGYTHTLDKDWTQAADLGNGLFQITMVSNNMNGSHTGHSLGTFKVQLPADTSVREARKIGNQMVVNDNNNDRLYLDPAARNVLYGQTPRLDFSQPAETTTTTAPTTTSTEQEPTTTVPESETTSTDPSETSSTTSTTASSE
jgi:hypothetical protein